MSCRPSKISGPKNNHRPEKLQEDKKNETTLMVRMTTVVCRKKCTHRRKLSDDYVDQNLANYNYTCSKYYKYFYRETYHKMHKMQVFTQLENFRRLTADTRHDKSRTRECCILFVGNRFLDKFLERFLRIWMFQ